MPSFNNSEDKIHSNLSLWGIPFIASWWWTLEELLSNDKASFEYTQYSSLVCWIFFLWPTFVVCHVQESHISKALLFFSQCIYIVFTSFFMIHGFMMMNSWRISNDNAKTTRRLNNVCFKKMSLNTVIHHSLLVFLKQTLWYNSELCWICFLWSNLVVCYDQKSHIYAGFY